MVGDKGFSYKKMVHKKYTYKGGHKYGPYLYKNKRVNGKVITTYVGKSRHNGISHLSWKFVAWAAILLVLFFLIAFIGLFSFPTAQMSSELNPTYTLGEPLYGTMRFNIREGELIPQDSKITVFNGNNSKDIFLSDAVVKARLLSGDFYAEHSSLKGFGEGYGAVGKKAVMPNVSFQILVYDLSEQGAYGSELRNSRIVNGAVRRGAPYHYSIGELKGAELLPGSVNFGGEVLPDDTVSFDLENGSISVSTEYFTSEEGFGEEYIGDYALSLVIDLSLFDIRVSERELSLLLSYNDIPLTSARTYLTIDDDDYVQLSSPKTSLVKPFPSFRLVSGESLSINLMEHFEGADSYEVNYLDGISSVVEDDTITFTSDSGFKGARSVVISALKGDDKVQSNPFLMYVSSGEVIESVSHSGIIAGRPVKWIKNVTLSVPEQTFVQLPPFAGNVSVKKVENGIEHDALAETLVSSGGSFTGMVSAEIKLKKKTGVFSFIKGVLKRITGFAIEESSSGSDGPVEVILQDTATRYVIEYYTPAPEIVESETAFGKKVVVSAPDALNYTNVLAYSSIPELYGVGQDEQIELHWSEAGVNLPFDAYDLDGNGLIDYLEWVVPHLSNQTFIIVLISKADHLDENRNYVEDIYPVVSSKDGIFKEIPAGHYIRVVFESNLTSSNDITLFARSSEPGASVQVYAKDGSTRVANFESIGEEGEYRAMLDALLGQEDSFDLLVSGGAVEFDYIVDPFADNGSIIQYVSDCGNLNTTGAIYYLTQDIIGANETCINITANNIVFDGQGHLINGNDSSINSYGIITNKVVGVNITNVNVSDFYMGVYFTSTNYSDLNRVNAYSNIAAGVMILRSINNQIYLINASFNNGDGLVVSSSRFNNLSLLTTHRNSVGVYVEVAHENTFNDLVAYNNTLYGLWFEGGANNTFTSFDISDNGRGVLLSIGNYNTSFYNGVINGLSPYLIGIGRDGHNCMFSNVSLINGNQSGKDILFTDAQINGTTFIDMPYIGSYDFTLGGKMNFEDSTYGSVRFTEPIYGVGANLSSEVSMGDGFVFVNGSNLGISKAADVMLEGISKVWEYGPILFKDGAVCTDCTDFVRYSEDTFGFSVSNGGNYSVSEDDSSLINCRALDVPGKYYTLYRDIEDLSGSDCFTFMADNIVLDGQGHEVKGIYSGIALNIQERKNITVKNATFNNFNTGMVLYYTNDSYFSDLNIVSVALVGADIRYSNYNNFSDFNFITNASSNYQGNSVYGVFVIDSHDNYFARGALAGTDVVDFLASLEGYLTYNNTFQEIRLPRHLETPYTNDFIVSGTGMNSFIDVNLSMIYFYDTAVTLEDSRYGRIEFPYINDYANPWPLTANYLYFGNNSIYAHGPNYEGNPFTVTFWGYNSSQVVTSKVREPVILKDGEVCISCTVNSQSLYSTPLSFTVSSGYGTYTFNMSSEAEIPIGKGWNMFSLPGASTEIYSVDVPLAVGDNLIGYSSSRETGHGEIFFTNESGDFQLQPLAATAWWGKVQYQFSYYNSLPGAKRMEFSPFHDSKLREGRGYWVHASEPGTLSFYGVRGPDFGTAVPWSSLNFSNGTSELTIDEAFGEGWIGEPGKISSEIIYYYGTLYDPEEPKDFHFVSDRGSDLYAWEGYFIWSNMENITLLV